MQNIVTDTPARTVLPKVPCPEWCVTDHSADLERLAEPGYIVEHNGETETFGECRVAFGDDEPRSAEVFQSLRVLADGTEVEYGMVLSGRLLDLAGMEALAAGLGSVR